MLHLYSLLDDIIKLNKKDKKAEAAKRNKAPVKRLTATQKKRANVLKAKAKQAQASKSKLPTWTRTKAILMSIYILQIKHLSSHPIERRKCNIKQLLTAKNINCKLLMVNLFRTNASVRGRLQRKTKMGMTSGGSVNAGRKTQTNKVDNNIEN